MKKNLDIKVTTNKKLKHVPHDTKFQNELGDSLFLWSSTQSALDINDFPLALGYNPYRFRKVCEINEYFADCFQYAKYNIASKLKAKVRDDELDRDYLFKLLPLLDPEYRALQIEKVTAAIESRNAGAITVEIKEIPDSEVVPVRITG